MGFRIKGLDGWFRALGSRSSGPGPPLLSRAAMPNQTITTFVTFMFQERMVTGASMPNHSNVQGSRAYSH